MSGKLPVSVPFTQRNSVEVGGQFHKEFVGRPPVTLSLKMPGSNPDSQSEYSDSIDQREQSESPDVTPTNLISDASTTNYSSEKTSTISDQFYRPDQHEQMQLDADNRVTSYVSFANFDEEAWLSLRAEKKATLQ